MFVPALKGPLSSAAYPASIGYLINAPVPDRRNSNKKIHSAFQTVNLQTDFWNSTPGLVEDFPKHGQKNSKRLFVAEL